MKKIIYDFGSNNGDDISYYLKKADLVVAVEANPELCRLITQRFEDAIKAGRLTVVNCVLTKHAEDNSVPFYIHKTNHVLSQFPRPANIQDYNEVYLPPRRASDIVLEYGAAHYIKIDVESYDQQILEDLFSAKIRPDFISAESHSIEVFATLVALGGYRYFKIVDGSGVSIRFQNLPIKTLEGEEPYSFPHHSAGPFGEDIPGGWFTPNDLFYVLAYVKLGWKDIHAARMPAMETPVAVAAPELAVA